MYFVATIYLHAVSNNSTFIFVHFSETTTKSPDAVASSLLNQTQNVGSLNSTEVNQLVNQLENLISAPNVSVDLGRTVLSVINNFLNSSSAALADSSNR